MTAKIRGREIQEREPTTRIRVEPTKGVQIRAKSLMNFNESSNLPQHKNNNEKKPSKRFSKISVKPVVFKQGRDNSKFGARLGGSAREIAASSKSLKNKLYQAAAEHEHTVVRGSN